MELQELPNELQGKLDGLNTWLDSAAQASSVEEYYAAYIETVVNAFSIGTAAIAATQAIAETASFENELALSFTRLRALNDEALQAGEALSSSQEYKDKWGGVYWAVSDCIATLRQTVNRMLMKIEDQSFSPSLAEELMSQAKSIGPTVRSYIDDSWEWSKSKVSELGDAFVTGGVNRFKEEIPTIRDEILKGVLPEVEARAKKGAVSGVMPLLVGAGVLVLVMMRKR